MNSIQNRLLITTTCVLVLFLALIGWVLDRSFRDSVVTGAEEQLRLVIYSLMGAVEERDGRLSFDEGLFEPRLSQPDSGLYARVTSDLGEVLWLSASAVTTAVPFPPASGEPGTFRFSASVQGVPRYHLGYTVIWEGVDTDQVIFSTATDQAPYRAAIAQFRRSLGLGFGAATLVFIVAQLLALRWGLLPLRAMAEEVQQLEAGQRDRLSASYPHELEGLAGNLDRFVAHEQRRRSRYRNAMEDLAHSLKTPMAVVRNGLLDARPDVALLREQLDRMETTVTHQLSRASASGPVVVGKSVALDALIERLLRALQSAYAGRDIEVQSVCDDAAAVRGDERDILEILGNLLENAFKYTHSTVRVSVRAAGHDVIVTVEDDGAGIPEALRNDVLSRGTRLDEVQPGQGIGLSVVAELVALYHGSLELGTSELGGAAVAVRLPA